jgi:hypothetical protein
MTRQILSMQKHLSLNINAIMPASRVLAADVFGTGMVH